MRSECATYFLKININLPKQTLRAFNGNGYLMSPVTWVKRNIRQASSKKLNDLPGYITITTCTS